MKESMWGYIIVALGIVIVAILLLVQRLTTTNEQDYYLGREIIKSSMFDAVDYGTYMKSGKLVMSKEKFVAVFTRRFAESVTPDRNYTLEFYDIHEYPPKATIRIVTNTGETIINNDALDLQVNTFITAILETEKDGELKVVVSTSYGDVDGNGTLDSTDLDLIYKYVNGQNVNTKYITRADVCGGKDGTPDGRVTIADYIVIKKALLSESLCDLNNDGVTDSADYELLKNNLGGKNLDSNQKLVADVDGNGTIDNTDLSILKTALGI